MSSSFAPIVQIYGVNTQLYERGLEGLDRETALRQLAPGTNPLVWIAGHMASTRFGVASMVGLERPLPWGKVFHKGATLEDLASLPDLDAVRQVWRDISEVLVPRLAELNDEQLAAPAPRAFRIEDKSIRGGISF